MTYALSLVTEPTSELLARADVERHLELDDDYHDHEVTAWIMAARQIAENYLNRAIGTQTWDLILDRFPPGARPILLPKCPVQSVSSVNYLDSTGASEIWSSSNYTLGASHEPARLTPVFNTFWPEHRFVEDGVSVRFVAGYTAANLPLPVKQAMLLLIGHLEAHRGDEGMEMPPQAFHLLEQYRMGDEFTCYS